MTVKKDYHMAVISSIICGHIGVGGKRGAAKIGGEADAVAKLAS